MIRWCSEYFKKVGVISTNSSLRLLPLLRPFSRLYPCSFDHGYYLLVKSIQELRSKKDGVVTVGIGGPSGSGKSSLAEKVASVIGCTVISMENYRTGVDDGHDLDSIDFDLLVQNLEDLTNGRDTLSPVFDFQGRRRIGSNAIKSISSGVVIVDGTYALHAKLRSLLDIRVAVVGGVHFSLLSKVQYDIGESCSLDYLIDSIFPLFRKHIEPDLHHAQIRINNSFVSSFREPIYKLKCKSESQSGLAAYIFHGKETQLDNFIEMYLRPPSASEEARINDWIKVRQSGIKYYLSLGDQRIVDKNYIIRPRAEFEVGRMTLGGLLALGYTVVVSYKRASTSVIDGNLSVSLETIDTLGETYMVLRGTNRKIVGMESSRLGITGPWITKSYLEMILERQGVPRLNTPPLLSNASPATTQERLIAAPKPLRITPNLVNRIDDLSQPWTRSPTKSKMEPVLATWHFISPDPLLSGGSAAGSPSSRDSLQLAPMPESYDLDRGLLLAVQAIQVIFEGVYALHPDIRKPLDLWIAVVGGVHSHLISRVQRDKSKVGCFMSQNEIMMTVFPMFQQHIEPHLVEAHLKIRNDFDPVLSPESSLFVLKSNKQFSSEFIDIYLRLPGTPGNGQLTESDCIRVRICEGRFALLIREGSSSASESSPSREASPLEGVIEDMQSRIKRLERWHAINT
ncbi:UNVERIFIED_CONTAM: Inorganic pyrophosphatase TTM2, partial [Sesamum angustifolium]